MGLLHIRDLHVVLHKMNLSILDSGILIICATSKIDDVLLKYDGLPHLLPLAGGGGLQDVSVSPLILMFSNCNHNLISVQGLSLSTARLVPPVSQSFPPSYHYCL